MSVTWLYVDGLGYIKKLSTEHVFEIKAVLRYMHMYSHTGFDSWI